MKTIKHIISYACDKRCSYCINEILTHTEKQCKNVDKITLVYYRLQSAGYNHLMISGGEPVLNKMFDTVLDQGSKAFDNVTVITAHISALSNKLIEEKATDVLFSIHHEYLPETLGEFLVSIQKPVYASMVFETWESMVSKYELSNRRLLKALQLLNFSGVTIREMYPNGKKVEDDHFLRKVKTEGFSVRVTDKSNCTKEEALLLPDLSMSTQKEFVELR